jgi:hypothetical protein
MSISGMDPSQTHSPKRQHWVPRQYHDTWKELSGLPFSVALPLTNIGLYTRDQLNAALNSGKLTTGAGGPRHYGKVCHRILLEWLGATTRGQAVEKLREAQQLDRESGHKEADQILCDFLSNLGYKDVVQEYEKIAGTTIPPPPPAPDTTAGSPQT